MSDPGHKIDAKTIATIVGLLSSLSGVVATWTLMQYRMDKLEERGFIERIADPVDRRALRVRQTVRGREIWSDIHQCGLRVRQLALQGLSEAEQDTLLRLLDQVRGNLSDED